MQDVGSLRVGYLMDPITNLLVKSKDSLPLLKWFLHALPYFDLTSANIFDQNMLHIAV